MNRNTLYIFGFIFFLAFSACKGGGSSPAPETLEAKLIRIQSFTLQTATVGSTDSKATFLLQGFTTVAADKVSTLTLYPSGTESGNWTVDSEDAFTLNYLDGTNSYALKFTGVTIENDVLKGTLEIPSGAGGQTAAVSAAVEYKK